MVTWERLQTLRSQISRFPKQKKGRIGEKGRRSFHQRCGRRSRQRRRTPTRRRTDRRGFQNPAEKIQKEAKTRRRALSATTLEGHGLPR
ncbi:hypothetical protein NDU88_000406 [Pleurodeles waltl]|uniref:Uncharacterized protein n=1 Tax=Pleurodeles waltl TaxID=8319 RepID=A0AAV7VXA9_PLEWA|nr:hypothetical protein NDU88_000406 [Pleurodeles waltl]